MSLLGQLRWSITVRTIAGTVDGKHRSDLLYVGEPLMVDVSLANITKAKIDLPRAFDAAVAESAWGLEKIAKGKAMAAQVRVAGMRSGGCLMEKWKEFEIVAPRTQGEIMGRHLHMALWLRWAGKPKESERELRTLLKMNPNSAAAYAELATLREQQQRFAEAAMYMEKAITLAESRAENRNEWAHEMRYVLKMLKQKAGK